ncbi:MAG: tRNA pseudouridine(38-40) synthase TruA [Cyanobacteriota bacterium]|nr:tRNA pseudouridine(38-40) synthase TruA [Cyanobacteriota bacterium]
MTVLRRIALKLQYLGTHFWGWQRQPRHRSVQAVLEEAIASRAHHPVVVHGAGRTDTGVHAGGQVAHFDTFSPIAADHWPEVLNNCLPADVAVLAASEVAQDWHARFSACWRRYRYLLFNQELPDVFWRPFSWHHRLPLNVSLMTAALQSLLGDHNLEAFRRAGSRRPHSWVRVDEVLCRQQEPLIWIEVQASGFLYRMMRLLMGALTVVGRGELTPEEFVQLWQQNDWSGARCRYSAPPQGLCLTGVGYPDDPFPNGIPTSRVGIVPGSIYGATTALSVF